MASRNRARVAILEAFHKLDPYHRPVLATKGSGEWEAEARDGRVKGVDVVGCQYLLSKEGVDSIAAAVTEQPIMSTEVNWNDGSFARDNLWQYWLDKGIAGSLLFDYSGGALDQPVPAVPPPDNDPLGMLIKRGNRDLYQDLVATAVLRADGTVAHPAWKSDALPPARHHRAIAKRRPAIAARPGCRARRRRSCCRPTNRPSRGAADRRPGRIHDPRRPAARCHPHAAAGRRAGTRESQRERGCEMTSTATSNLLSRRIALAAFILLLAASTVRAQCVLTETRRKFEGAEHTVVHMENERIIVEVVPELEGRIIKYVDKSRPASGFEWLDDCPYHYGGRWEGVPFQYHVNAKGPAAGVAHRQRRRQDRRRAAA